MIDYREHNQTAKVEDYGLAEWLAKVQKLIQEGYVFDFTTNENYPLVFGSMYTAILVKPSEQSVITEIEPQVVIQGDAGKLETSESGEQTYVSKPLEQTNQDETPSKVDGRKKKVS